MLKKIIKDGSGQASNSVGELMAHVHANSSFLRRPVGIPRPGVLRASHCRQL